MRNALFAILAVTFALACKKAARIPARAQEATARVPASLSGKLLETIDAAQYTYLRLQTKGDEVWAAVTTTKQAVGTEVTIVGPIWMENFKSSSLNRTWPRIAFGTLDGEAATQPAAVRLPSGHPATASANKDLGPIKVAKASGSQGRTIADVWAERAQLQNKRIAIRGKVVKATNGVMGKNWLHVRDGTGNGETSDLTVATEDTAAVGDTVLISGTVHLNRELGAGYRYDVIVEDAQIKAE